MRRARAEPHSWGWLTSGPAFTPGDRGKRVFGSPIHGAYMLLGLRGRRLRAWARSPMNGETDSNGGPQKMQRAMNGSRKEQRPGSGVFGVMDFPSVQAQSPKSPDPLRWHTGSDGYFQRPDSLRACGARLKPRVRCEKRNHLVRSGVFGARSTGARRQGVGTLCRQQS